MTRLRILMALSTLALIFLSGVLGGKDYYSILNIKKNLHFTSSSVINLNQDDPNAVSKFQDIATAYEVLSDPDKRRKYDKCGEECVNQPENQGGMNPFGDMFGDVFSQFMGGGRQQEKVGPSARLKVRVTLEDIYNGKQIPITYSRMVMCPHCRGSGADDPDDVEVCRRCNGNGQITETRQLGPGFVQQFQRTCPDCNGEGRRMKSKCHVCQGDKTVRSMDELSLFIEKGIPDGYEYKFKDAADEYVTQRSGEIIIKIETVPHPTFERSKNDLKTTVKLTLREALLGFEKELKHLDGRKIRLSRTKVTKPGEVEKIRGEGMSVYEYPSDRGDLIITYQVVMPDKLTQEQKEMFRLVFNMPQ